MVTTVLCDKNRKGSKGNGDKGGGKATATRAMAMATAMTTEMMWAMGMTARWAGDEESKGKGGKGNCDGDEGGGRRRGQRQQGQW